MSFDLAGSEATFGYLSTWDSPEHGCLGGYLVVSHLGRPLEFHCTAPLRPIRAQQILFGPTLWPYVLGEQIGGALLAEGKLRPRVVLTNHPVTLCLRPQIALPMAFLKSAAGSGGQSSEAEVNALQIADCTFELALGFESDRDALCESLAILAKHVDLAEPFQRIHEAIREAQRLGGHDPLDAYEQAA